MLKMKVNEENNTPILDEKGRIAYVDDTDGKELFLDPISMYSKISDLNKENQNHRKKNEEIVSKFKIFESIEDVEKWKEEADKALSTIANFNDKDWMKAEKVEQLKREMAAAYEDKIKAAGNAYGEKEKAYKDIVDKLNSQIRNLLISNKFAVSKYFNGGDQSVTILPANIAEDHFGKYFKVEEIDGRPTVKAYYSNGDVVHSREKPGEIADFEEAIGLIIDKYPGKDSILRASSGGSGAGGGEGSQNSGSELDKLQRELAEAQKNGNVKLSISIKNRIAELRRKQQ